MLLPMTAEIPSSKSLMLHNPDVFMISGSGVVAVRSLSQAWNYNPPRQCAGCGVLVAHNAGLTYGTGIHAVP